MMALGKEITSICSAMNKKKKLKNFVRDNYHLGSIIFAFITKNN